MRIWWNGRHAGFRFQSERVQVQLLLSAPFNLSFHYETNGKYGELMEKISFAGREWNEDYAFSGEQFSFVIDGATSLTPEKFSNEETDAKWFSLQFGEFLKKELKHENLSISEIVKKGIIKIAKDFKKLSGKHNVIDMPSACIAIVRRKQNKLEYFVLGDCGFLFRHKNSVKEFTTKKLSKLDKINIDTMVKIAKEKNIDVIQARKFVDSDILRKRLSKNTKNGYWVLCDSIGACDHALQGELSIESGDEILLYSDGFSQLWDILDIFKKKQIFQQLDNGQTLVDLFNLLHKTQKEDSGCNKFPRTKIHDDSSAVYFKI